MHRPRVVALAWAVREPKNLVGLDGGLQSLGSRLASKLLGFWLSDFGLDLGSRLASTLLISGLLAVHRPQWITLWLL